MEILQRTPLDVPSGGSPIVASGAYSQKSADFIRGRYCTLLCGVFMPRELDCSPKKEKDNNIRLLKQLKPAAPAGEGEDRQTPVRPPAPHVADGHALREASKASRQG